MEEHDETETTPARRTNSEKDNQEDCCQCGETTSILIKYVLLRSFRLCLYCLDISSDIAVAIGDYQEGKEIFGYITVGLVFSPGIFLSFYMLCDSIWNYAGELACLRGLLWVLFSPLIPAWPILRDVRLIMMGLVAAVCPSRRKTIVKHLNEPSKAYLLKFLEAFTEAAPQLVVRLLKICLNNPRQFSDLRSSEITQMCFSFTMLALTVVSTHQKNVSTNQVIEGSLETAPKYKLACISQIFALIWWLSFLFARLQALALFGASYHYWIFLVLGIHVLLMFLLQTISSHKDRLQRIFIYLFGAFVFIFAYIQFNLKSKVKVAAWVSYTLFTILVFLENTVMMVCWLYRQNELLTSGLISSEYNQTELGSVNSTSTLNYTSQPLKSHWELLLFTHYGAFSISLIFMILTFFCTSSRHAETDEESSAVELDKLNS